MAKKAAKRKPARKKSSAKKRPSGRKTTRSSRSAKGKRSASSPTKAVAKKGRRRQQRAPHVPFVANPSQCDINPPDQHFDPGDLVQFETHDPCTLQFALPSPIGDEFLQLQPGPPVTRRILGTIRNGWYPFWIVGCTKGRRVSKTRPRLKKRVASGPSDIIVP